MFQQAHIRFAEASEQRCVLECRSQTDVPDMRIDCSGDDILAALRTVTKMESVSDIVLKVLAGFGPITA
jgi:hypothetical protein